MGGHTKKIYGLVKLSMLNTQPEGSTVDYAALIESKAATKDKFKLKKVVSSPGGLTVKAHAFTESAKAAIEGKGGTCVLLSPTTQLPLEASDTCVPECGLSPASLRCVRAQSCCCSV